MKHQINAIVSYDAYYKPIHQYTPMRTNPLCTGLWPVMLTPFQENNALDVKGLESLTEFYIHTGADGLFANCLSSEMFQLTNEERLTVINTVMKQAEGKVPVIATGTFSQDLDNNVDFIKKVYDTGVAAVIINANQLTDSLAYEDIFKQKLEAILQHTEGIPLGVYECPVPYKRLLSPSLMKWMADSGRFLYHKDTSCDLIAIENKLSAIQASPLGLYNANVPTALQSLQKGARGLSPIGANFYPELFSFLINNYQDTGKAAQIRKVNALLSVLDPLVHMHYPLSAKFFLQKRGLQIGLNTRISVVSMAAQDLIRLDDLLTVFQKIANEVGQPVIR